MGKIEYWGQIRADETKIVANNDYLISVWVNFSCEFDQIKNRYFKMDFDFDFMTSYG